MNNDPYTAGKWPYTNAVGLYSDFHT